MLPRTYQRAVSPFERMWIAAHQACPQLVIEGRGNIDPLALERAIALAAERNPGSRLVLRGFGPWLSWHAVDTPPPLHVQKGDGWDGKGPSGADFLREEGIDLRRGPSCNLTLVTSPVPRLILRAHHGVMDGMGMIWFVREIMSALRGEEPRGHLSEHTDLELARALGGQTRSLPQRAARLIGGASEDTLGVTWARHTIPYAVKNPLARVLAFIARVAGRDGDDVLVDVPADLRREFPDVHSTGNLTGSIRLSLRASDTPEEIAAQIKAKTSEHRQADALVSSAYIRFIPLWLVRMISNQMRRKSVRSGQYSPTAVIANIGRFDMQDFSAGDFEATSVFGIPPAFEGTPLMITMSGGPNHVEMGARAPLALASQGRLEGMLQQIAKELS